MKKADAIKYIESIRKVTDYFENCKGMIPLPEGIIDSNGSYFSCNATGTGMCLYGIDDGDYLVFEVSDTITSGEIGMFIYGEMHTTVCRLYKEYDDGGIYLLGDPNVRQPIKIDKNDLDFSVVGQLVAVVKNMRNKKF